MKRFITILLTVSLVFILVACGKDEAPEIKGADDVSITVGGAFVALDGITATDKEDGDITSSITVSGSYDVDAIGTYDITYTVKDSADNETIVSITLTVTSLAGCGLHEVLVDGVCEVIPAETITIMHGAVHEIDPFHEDYSGTEQQARQELQREVEARLNVVIEYKQYPSDAGWGPNRIDKIIRQSVAGEPLADIYWITSDWTQQLVDENAIADISQYLNTHGKNIPDIYSELGSYKGGIYGFEANKVTIGQGLYYNADLVSSLGVENPTQLYLDGEWNWTKFEAWSVQVQTALSSQGEDMFALGGHFSEYAQNMVALNGGALLSAKTGRVSFTQSPALETYDFLNDLYGQGVFEEERGYDSGSTAWQAGKVAMHPGSLWFVNSDVRWGGLSFELGFVPFPVADDYTGDYTSPVSGVAMMSIASGMEAEREELVFQVWNEIQLWKTEAEAIEAFETTLLTKFDDEIYIEAYLEVYDKVYLDLLHAVGINRYTEQGWTRNINLGIKEGTSRTLMDGIKPIYEAALDEYLEE